MACVPNTPSLTRAKRIPATRNPSPAPAAAIPIRRPHPIRLAGSDQAVAPPRAWRVIPCDHPAGPADREGVAQFVNQDRGEGGSDPGHQPGRPETGVEEEQAEDQEGGADRDPEPEQRKADH